MENLLKFTWVANRLHESGRVYGWGGYDKDNKLRLAVNEIFKPSGGVSLGYSWFIYKTEEDGVLSYSEIHLDIMQAFAELSKAYSELQD